MEKEDLRVGNFAAAAMGRQRRVSRLRPGLFESFPQALGLRGCVQLLSSWSWSD